MVNPELAKSILEKHEFDYVIGSVHKIGTLTLSNVAYNAHNVEDICLNYLDAMYELADEGDFDCLGHIDMIRLYAAKQGTPLDMLEYEDQLVPILRRVIERGKGIEINTTGFRQEISTTLPNLDLLNFTAASAARSSPSVPTLIAPPISVPAGANRLSLPSRRGLTM